MKNKIVKRILVLVIIIMSLFCLNKYINVKADSGWDSDYDSGSSWDSGSDWGSDSSWDSDGTRSRGSSCTTKECRRITLIVSLTLIGLFIGIPVGATIISSLSEKNKKNGKDTTDIYKEIKEEEAKKIIPNFDIKEFNFKAYQMFYDIQIAWMEFDYDKLKDLLTDELYNTYKMDLETLTIKKQKNIMKDFELVNTKLINLEEKNNIYSAKVVTEVKFIDYVENIKTHNIVRGNSKRKLDNTYILTFIKTKKEQEKNICPKCGAEIKGKITEVCEYCRTKLTNGNHDWIMSQKEKISQK